MSDTPQREWRFYLNDMIGFAEKVIAYADDLDIDNDTLWSIVRSNIPVMPPRLIALRGKLT